MPSLNKVFLAGNLTRDPEVRYTPSNMAVSDLGLAVNRRYRTKDGQDREDTLFINVTVFAKTAENCGRMLHKGSPVLVEGRLRLEEWERDGKKNSRISVIADSVQFLESRGGGGGRSGGAREDAPPGGGAADRAEEGAGAVETHGEPMDHDDGDNLPF